MSHIKGERWLLYDGREIIVTWDLRDQWLRVLNQNGMLEVIPESHLKKRLDVEAA